MDGSYCLIWKVNGGDVLTSSTGSVPSSGSSEATMSPAVLAETMRAV